MNMSWVWYQLKEGIHFLMLTGAMLLAAVGVFLAFALVIDLIYDSASPTTGPEPEYIQVAPNVYVIPTTSLRMEAYEFYLDDGTRCMTLGTSAVTCEWRQPSCLTTAVD